MTRVKNDRVAEDPGAVSEESSSEEEVDEFADGDDDVVSADLDEFEDEADDGDSDTEAVEVVVELSSKEQSARSLEIRRAIEKRMEDRRFHEDLDYLDYDLDD